KLEELNTGWHYLSLEKIFFENRVYRILEDNAKSWEAQLDEVFKKMAEYESLLRHPIEKEDILKLVEKPVRKISKFDVKDITNKISSIEKEIEKTEYDLRHIIEYTIAYYGDLKQRYGSKYPRLTALGDFETISATKVVATNAKLYVNRDEGFIGTDLKKDDKAEYLCECSDIDDVIIFLKNGLYKVTKVSEKAFVGKDIIYAGIYIKNDKRTIYNAVYKDGKRGFNYVKRFSVPSVTRDKEYDLTKGSPDSRILWFSANPNGEAEVIKVFIRPRPKLKKLIFEYNFADLAIKGRNSMGNILSRNPLHKIQLKSKGISTIGGKSIWFDTDINRLNEDSHGLFIGEFKDDEQILVICREGKYYTTNYDLSNRYQGSLLKIEKFDGGKVFSAIYFDGASGFYYIKRFRLDISENIVASFISEDANSKLIGLSEDEHPCITIKFGGKNQNRAEEIINAEEFIGIKGFRAKGKRLTTYEVADVSFSTPLETDESEIKKSGDDKQDNIDEQLSEEKETISENDENDSPTLF
ncbi:MAG: DNA gyrase/topoisomerase IV subunit A, partial [Bacteroidales bacterium]|nr:DNA gyrase/topoisomerase IV subunit A [Bacteroidales bacterium]